MLHVVWIKEKAGRFYEECTKFVIIIVVCVCVILGGYYYLTNRNNAKEEENITLTEIQELTTKI